MENMDVELGDVNIVHEAVRSFLDSVGEKKNVSNKSAASIYMAPINLRKLSPNSFKPRVVSIGPLHRNDETLQQFEVRKATFVQDLLCRPLGPSLKQTSAACMQKVVSIIKKIRDSYADVQSYDDIQLAKMMVMDACFILEFIYTLPKVIKLRLQDECIRYDLVLLENQIPFFVLEDVYECIKYKFNKRPPPLTIFILPLLDRTNLFQERIKVGGSPSSANHDHILGYMYHCYKPANEVVSGFPRSTFHSAVELERAGVNFKPNKDAKWPLAMEVKESRYCLSLFWFSKPTLTMPKLCIDDFTELVLRNLIAYEQSYTVNPYVTSYARAMDMIIHTPEDIDKLVKSQVIVNQIGSNEEAAKMISGVCNEVVPERFFYTHEWGQLDSHCKRYVPKKVAKLRRTCSQLKVTYFSSPWSIIALLAGITLFVLTWVQTIFTVKSSI